MHPHERCVWQPYLFRNRKQHECFGCYVNQCFCDFSGQKDPGWYPEGFQEFARKDQTWRVECPFRGIYGFSTWFFKISLEFALSISPSYWTSNPSGSLWKMLPILKEHHLIDAPNLTHKPVGLLKTVINSSNISNLTRFSWYVSPKQFDRQIFLHDPPAFTESTWSSPHKD